MVFGDTSLSDDVWGELLCEVYEMKVISTSLTDVHNDPIPDLLKLLQQQLAAITGALSCASSVLEKYINRSAVMKAANTRFFTRDCKDCNFRSI